LILNGAGPPRFTIDALCGIADALPRRLRLARVALGSKPLGKPEPLVEVLSAALATHTFAREFLDQPIYETHYKHQRSHDRDPKNGIRVRVFHALSYRNISNPKVI
jgi:hypothetical protein